MWPRPKGCWHCGTGHEHDVKCPAQGATCNYFHNKGHWEKVCKQERTCTGARQKYQPQSQPQSSSDRPKGWGKAVQLSILSTISQAATRNFCCCQSRYFTLKTHNIMIDEWMGQAFANVTFHGSGVRSRHRRYVQRDADQCLPTIIPWGIRPRGAAQFEVQVSNSLADLKWFGGVPIKQYGDRDIHNDRADKSCSVWWKSVSLAKSTDPPTGPTPFSVLRNKMGIWTIKREYHYCERVLCPTNMI